MTDTFRKQIEELIVGIMAPHEENAVKDTAENYFGQFDSLRFIELIVGVENNFGIALRDDDLIMDENSTLDDFVGKIEKYLTEPVNA